MRAALRWLAPWLVVAALAAVTAWRYAPPAPLPADAPAEHFSAGRAQQALAELLDGIDAHPIGSPDAARVVERIDRALRVHGLHPIHDRAFACGPYLTCAPVHNLTARIPGRSPGSGTVLVVAHHDSVGAGPGASDDGHGIAVLLELARLATTRAWDRDILLLVTDGEEAGLIGAQRFADTLDGSEPIVFVINLEARGTSGPGILFESNADPAALAALFGTHAARPVITSLARPVYEALPHDTDFSVLARRGLPGANLAIIDGASRYHTPRDDLDHLDPHSLQHQGDNTLALLDAMASLEHTPTPLGRSSAPPGVYFDLYTLLVLRWPPGVAPVLAVLAALLTAACATLAVRRGLMRTRGLLAAIGAWPLVFVTAALAPVGLAFALRATGALPAFLPFAGNAAWVVVSALGAVVAVVSAAATLTARWIDARTWLAATATGHALLAVATAALVEPASYPFVIAAMGAAGALLVMLRFDQAPGERSGPPRGTTLAVATCALGVLPVAWLLHMATGVGPIQPATALAALIAATALPALGGWPGRPILLPASALAVCLVAATIATVQGPWTADHPRPVNLLYRQHYAAGDHAPSHAHWLAMTLHDAVPASLREVADFAGRPEPMTPWAHPLRTVDTAPAPVLDLGPPPRLEVLDSQPDGALRRVLVRVQSPRGAPLAALFWHDTGRVVHASVEGIRLGRRVDSEWDGVDLYALPAEGVTVELYIRGDEPLEVWLMDKSYGLPEEGRFLLEHLPAHATALQDGHASLVTRITTL